MGKSLSRKVCPIGKGILSFLVAAGIIVFPSKICGAAASEVHLKIKEIVKQLDYSQSVAEEFLAMVCRWKEKDGRETLLTWYEEITGARSKFKEGKMSARDLALVEAAVAGRINDRILKEIRISDKLDEYFLLQEVVRDREMLCLGYCQVYYVTANAVGLKARVVEVTGYAPIYLSSPRLGHVACLVMLEDGLSMMIDYSFKSAPFRLKETFAEEGIFFRMRDKSNPLKMHTRIQILDELGIKAHLQRNLAKRYEKAGDYQNALGHYSRAIELDPKFAPRVNRGSVYDELGLPDKALADYNQALSIDPESVTAYCCRGTLYDSRGNYEKALADYDRAIELRPKMALLYSNRGSTYLKKGERGKAIADLSVAIDLDPGYVRAFFQRGNAYFDMGQCEKAIRDYGRTLELDRNYTHGYVNRGLCYAKTGEKAKAAQDLKKALERDPSLKEWIMRKAEEYKLDLAKP